MPMRDVLSDFHRYLLTFGVVISLLLPVWLHRKSGKNVSLPQMPQMQKAHATGEYMIDQTQLKILIADVLGKLGDKYASQSAINLLMGTAAQESKLGTFWYQIGGGPGLGIFQMEPETENSIWYDYLDYHPELKFRVISLTGLQGPSPFNLKYNLAYQIIMARIKYYWHPEPLPAADDIQGMAESWKVIYNTELGAGTEKQFIENYREMVL